VPRQKLTLGVRTFRSVMNRNLNEVDGDRLQLIVLFYFSLFYFIAHMCEHSVTEFADVVAAE